MDILFLKSLLAVLDHGSIAAAARTENITATAISQRIKTLESQLECQLLSRVGHKALPTEECLRLEPTARKIVSELQILKQEALSGELMGTLKLGAISTALIDFVPNLAQSIREDAPRSNLMVIPGTSSELYDRLLREEIDGALLVEPNFKLPKFLHSTLISSQPLCFISKHNTAPDTIKQNLESKPLIVYDRESWGGKLAWEWISKTSNNNKILCEIDSLETIACMVEKGLGVAVIPKWSDLTTRYDVAICDTNNSTDFDRDIVFVSSRASPFQGLISVCKRNLQTVMVNQPSTALKTMHRS